MNYLIACDDLFPHTPAGAARVAWDLAVLMRERGHHVGFICGSSGGSTSCSGVVEGVDVLCCSWPERRKLGLSRVQAVVDAVAEGARTWSGTRWDVLHTHSLMTGLGVLKGLPNITRRVCTVHSPVVLEQRINWAGRGLAGLLKLAVAQPVIRRLERRVLDASHEIHTLSDYTRWQLDHFHGVGHRVTVVPHWVRPDYIRTCDRAEARRRLGWSNNIPTVFTVRRHVARMGLDTAIRAVGPLAAAGVCRLVVGGDGPLRGELQRLSTELRCDAAFTGRLSEDELRLAYQAADLFLLPSRSLECFGLISLEAMAMGCPVLGTRVGAIPEVLEPITPELLIAPDDADSMSSKLQSIFSGDLRLPPADVLTGYVQRRYGREVITPQLTTLIQGAHNSAVAEA